MIVKPQDYLSALISNGIEESLQWEYKSSGSLDRSNKKKIDISITVSGMANATGGIVIFVD